MPGSKRLCVGSRRIGGQINEGFTKGRVTTLFVHVDRVQIKIEVTPVIRGTVFQTLKRSVKLLVEETFGFAEMPLVSFPDLYAGKAVAGLDRQHPRDFFDWRDLLEHEGINDELRRAFLVYMVSHGRPMFEVLAPPRKDLTERFTREFDGMTEKPVKIEELVTAREDLISGMVGGRPDSHCQFLLSFERGQPEWKTIGIAHVADLPAVKWRQENLDELPKDKRAALGPPSRARGNEQQMGNAALSVLAPSGSWRKLTPYLARPGYTAEQLPDEMRARGFSYWGRRLAAKASPDPDSSRLELGGIGQWCLREHIDDRWLADQFLVMLQAGFAPTDAFSVVDWLEKAGFP